MTRRMGVAFFLLSLCLPFVLITSTQAQQTLGGITGTVADTTGALITDATVTAVNDQTGLTRTETSSADGAYNFVNLPDRQLHAHLRPHRIRDPEDTLDPRSGEPHRHRKRHAQGRRSDADRHRRRNALLNAVDTTNGYVMDKSQIDAVPLPTGSFTGLAILSPGVNAELSGGTGANSGLGNAPVWANGQRDTSNTFLLNGVDAKNLFNGKTTSQVASARVVNATGVSTSSALSSLPGTEQLLGISRDRRVDPFAGSGNAFRKFA